MYHMYLTDLVYGGHIFMVPLSTSYESSPEFENITAVSFHFSAVALAAS